MPIDQKQKIAYFSMEIGLDTSIRSYSGGLGVLAGDTIKSCADLRVPIVGVTLLYKKGYFDQKLDEDGNQFESPYQWSPEQFLERLEPKVTVLIEGREVAIQAWQYNVKGVDGHTVSVFFLDSDFSQNDERDRNLTQSLYGGDERHRLAQEILLGIGGLRMLKILGYNNIHRYHMNEGHSSLLTVELLRQHKREKADEWDFEGVRRKCVFTTHTPVPAGHDQFSYDIVEEVLGKELIPISLLKEIAGSERLNMTHLALELSHYMNGVAKQHGKISQEMFPGYRIDSITNGVHSDTWTCEAFSQLYDKYIPGWRYDPFSLRNALNIPQDDIWKVHAQAKKDLINYIHQIQGTYFEDDVLTIGFARRATSYKRADLVFFDLERLRTIMRDKGKIQFVFAGKAHPKDTPGMELIKKIFKIIKTLEKEVKIVYLPNYDMALAKKIISGVDLWLNTPRKPQEASGTSGMKAAHNGVPSLSILDGWWIEGCLEGLTGWAIGSASEIENDDAANAEELYQKLEKEVIPAFYRDRDRWISVMRYSIALNAAFFNTHRMVQQYVLNAYL